MHPCIRSPLSSAQIQKSSSSPRWTYLCDQRQKICLKTLKNSSEEETLSEGRCQVGCAPERNLWPLPNSFQQSPVGHIVFNPEAVNKVIEAPTQEVQEALEEAIDWQLSHLKSTKHSQDVSNKIRVQVRSSLLDIDVSTNEQYELHIECSEHQSDVLIVAETYFGARHGLGKYCLLIGQ